MKQVVATLLILMAVPACHSQRGSKSETADFKALHQQLAKDGALYISVSELVARRLLKHGGEDVVIRTGGEARVTGTVLVGFELDKNGDVRCPTAMEGPKLLQESAKSAVAKWKFKPYQLNGQNIAVFTTVHVAVALKPTGGP